MLKIGDAIVHPLHGAGTICGIEQRKFGGIESDYFQIKISFGEMLVLIPTDNCEAVGIRPIISLEKAREVLAAIPSIDIDEEPNWNKRYKDNMERIRSGDLLSVAAVIKSLVRRERRRGLSTGERKMLHSAKQIFVSELSLSMELSCQEAEDALFAAIDEDLGA